VVGKYDANRERALPRPVKKERSQVARRKTERKKGYYGREERRGSGGRSRRRKKGGSYGSGMHESVKVKEKAKRREPNSELN